MFVCYCVALYDVVAVQINSIKQHLSTSLVLFLLATPGTRFARLARMATLFDSSSQDGEVFLEWVPALP